MKLSELEEIFGRIGRVLGLARQKAGSGAEWEAMVDDGSVHQFKINGVVDPDKLKDDVAHLCLLVWSAKDHLKKRAATLGRDDLDLEAIAGADACMPTCADLANGIKHGLPLHRSRTGKPLRLGNVCYTVHQDSLGQISIGAESVSVTPSNLENVVVSVPVIDSAGAEYGDALEFLRGGIECWESVLACLENAQ